MGSVPQLPTLQIVRAENQLAKGAEDETDISEKFQSRKKAQGATETIKASQLGKGKSLTEFPQVPWKTQVQAGKITGLCSGLRVQVWWCQLQRRLDVKRMALHLVPSLVPTPLLEISGLIPCRSRSRVPTCPCLNHGLFGSQGSSVSGIFLTVFLLCCCTALAQVAQLWLSDDFLCVPVSGWPVDHRQYCAPASKDTTGSQNSSSFSAV